MLEILFGAGITLFVWTPLGFAAAYLMNEENRANLANRYLKANMARVNFLTQQRKIIEYIINLKSDKIQVENRIWKTDNGFLSTEKTERGFFFENASPVLRRGLPTIFVDSKSCLPLKFEGEPAAKPGDLGAWAISESKIMEAEGEIKNRAAREKMIQILLIICAVGALAAVAAAVISLGGADSANVCATGIGDIKTTLEAVCGATVQNGSIVFR